MKGRVIVSVDGGLRELTWPLCGVGGLVRLEGAGPLCAREGAVFCACPGNRVIWRLDARSLTPTGLFAGGPGMCALRSSPDGSRLYALCAEADSLLMLDGATGMPIALNRVGVNPGAMAMDEAGEVIAVAGGECARTVLLCARTLNVLSSLPVAGVATGVAIGAGAVYTLCLTETLSSALTAYLPGGARWELPLAGTPGTLCLCPEGLLAATEGRLYAIAADGSRVLSCRETPGRAKRLLDAQGQRLLLDEWSGTLLREGRSRWLPVLGGVHDLAPA